MKSAALCVVALLPAACSTIGRSGATPEAAAPLATGVLKSLDSANSSVKGGLVWTGTVKAGVRCAIYENWIRIDAADAVIWIPREQATYLELQPTSN